jgi:hypothetical protein
MIMSILDIVSCRYLAFDKEATRRQPARQHPPVRQQSLNCPNNDAREIRLAPRATGGAKLSLDHCEPK